MSIASRISKLQNANSGKRDKIDTLKRYSKIFKNKKSGYKAIHTQDKNICDSPSFWKGELFEEFKQLADDGLRREGYKYYLSFDKIEAEIQDKIGSLESEISNNKDKIKDLQRQQKG